jgi:hypothetical protein
MSNTSIYDRMLDSCVYGGWSVGHSNECPDLMADYVYGGPAERRVQSIQVVGELL